MIDIVVLSEVCLYREGVARLLSTESDLRVVATAASAAEAISTIERGAARVLLVDTAVPYALDVVRRLASEFAGLRVVALGVRDEDESVLAFAEAGVTGYVCRDGTSANLAEAVRNASSGELNCSRRIAGALIERLGALAGSARLPSIPPALTQREAEVVRLVDEGLTNKEIAARLHVASATARNHVHNILAKLGARTRSAAAAVARRSQFARLVLTGSNDPDLHPR